MVIILLIPLTHPHLLLLIVTNLIIITRYYYFLLILTYIYVFLIYLKNILSILDIQNILYQIQYFQLK